MKTYILMKNVEGILASSDIKVKDIHGIYQNKCKGFWECKVVNLKMFEDTKRLDEYILKEIELDNSEIVTTYRLKDKNNIEDLNTHKKYKIPVFYNYDIKNKIIYDDLI